MIHTLFTILVGLATMTLFVLAVGVFGWLTSDFNKDPAPDWVEGLCAVIFIVILIDIAYWVGRWVLGVLA